MHVPNFTKNGAEIFITHINVLVSCRDDSTSFELYNWLKNSQFLSQSIDAHNPWTLNPDSVQCILVCLLAS